MVRKRLSHFLGGLLLFLMVGCNAPPESFRVTSLASPICVLKNADNHRLLGHLHILSGTSRNYTIEDIAQPQLQSRFVLFADKTFEPRSHQPYWGKIQLENRLPDAEAHSECYQYVH